MLESFLAADRGFAKARKDRQLDGTSRPAMARQPARRRTAEPNEPSSTES